jgi:Protein tyrosine and serine/threonine kinase
VAKIESYDTKCDVFSFAILLWEMLALRGAYQGYSSNAFMEKVVMESERLPVCKSWPPLTRLMIPEAWDDNPRKRPDMKRVAILIRGDLNDMTTDDRILHRTRHLQNRSQHSLADMNEESSSSFSGQFHQQHRDMSVVVVDMSKKES